MPLNDRRTQTVLVTLIAGMTLVSGALMLLEPPSLAPVIVRSMSASESTVHAEQRLLHTRSPLEPERWQGIVIQCSGAQSGSAQTLNDAHLVPFGGLAHHFVINNGSGAPDGDIEIGFRWDMQLVGTFGRGPDANWYNTKAIGICLIGDQDQQAPTQMQMEQLVWLVRHLQREFNIPRDRVYVQTSAVDPDRPGRLFPVANFSSRLLVDTSR